MVFEHSLHGALEILAACMVLVTQRSGRNARFTRGRETWRIELVREHQRDLGRVIRQPCSRHQRKHVRAAA